MAAVDSKLKDGDRYAGARALGIARARGPSAILEAHYDPARDAIALTFRGGGAMLIPRQIIPGLKEAPTSALIGPISISPAADALSWPSLDVDIYIPGLVE